MRVVIDSSVLVAALTTPNPISASRVVLAAAAAGAVQLVVTEELEAEYRRAVEYPKVARYAAKVNRQKFVSAVIAVAVKVDGAVAAGAVPNDPADDKVVAAALGGGAEVVVSLDRHLLDIQAIPGVRILRPGDFLVELRASAG